MKYVSHFVSLCQPWQHDYCVPVFSQENIIPSTMPRRRAQNQWKKQPAGPPSLKEKSVYALNFGYTKNTYDEKYLFFQLMRKIGQDKNSIFRRVKMCFYGCNRSHHIFRLNWWSQSAQRLCPNFVSFEKLNLGKGIQGKTKTCQLMLSKDFRDLKRAGTMPAAISTTSQRFMKEKPRKRPRVPPNSATKDKKCNDWGG